MLRASWWFFSIYGRFLWRPFFYHSAEVWSIRWNRWNSLGYHMQTGNEDNFLSLDFVLQEFGIMNANERLRGYRRYVCEAGAVDRSEFGQRKVIGEMVVEKKRKKEFEFGFSQSCGMRSIFSVDGTDQKLKSGPDPLFMPNIPSFPHAIVP